MATVKYGPLVQEVAGTIGGVTFARGYRSKCARGWRAPTKKKSTAQTNRRFLLSLVASQWLNERTDEDRELWEDYAPTCVFQNSLGEDYTLNGYGMYVRNQNILQAVISPIYTVAPYSPGFGISYALTFLLTHSTGQLSITEVLPTPTAETYMIFEIHTLRPITRQFPYLSMIFRGIIGIAGTPPYVLYEFPTPLPLSAGKVQSLCIYYIFMPDHRLSKDKWQLTPSE